MIYLKHCNLYLENNVGFSANDKLNIFINYDIVIINVHDVVYTRDIQFWPRNVVKRVICHDNVCLSVCLSFILLSQNGVLTILT